MPSIGGHFYFDNDDVLFQIYGSNSIPVGILFNDDEFILGDTGDKTKNLEFELSGITTGTKRTWTVQDADGTVALLEASQLFTGTQQFYDGQFDAITGIGATFSIDSGTSTRWAQITDAATGETLGLEVPVISASNSLIFPTSGTVVSTSAVQNLSNKTFTTSTVFANDFTLNSGVDLILNTGTGTKLGTATGQKLGFWNASPVAQQTTGSAAATFVANTSNIADDSATFDGYTLGQVVKILRTIGILA